LQPCAQRKPFSTRRQVPRPSRASSAHRRAPSVVTPRAALRGIAPQSSWPTVERPRACPPVTAELRGLGGSDVTPPPPSAAFQLATRSRCGCRLSPRLLPSAVQRRSANAQSPAHWTVLRRFLHGSDAPATSATIDRAAAVVPQAANHGHRRRVPSPPWSHPTPLGASVVPNEAQDRAGPPPADLAEPPLPPRLGGLIESSSRTICGLDSSSVKLRAQKRIDSSPSRPEPPWPSARSPLRPQPQLLAPSAGSSP